MDFIIICLIHVIREQSRTNILFDVDAPSGSKFR